MREIATAQRRANLAVFLLYLCFIPLALLTFLGAIVALAAGANEDNVTWVVIVMAMPLISGTVWSAVSVYNLATQLRGRIAGVICLLGLLVPMLGLIILLLMSSEATKLFNKSGIKVGLLGANPNEI